MENKQNCDNCKKWKKNIIVIRKESKYISLFEDEETKPKMLCKRCRK